MLASCALFCHLFCCPETASCSNMSRIISSGCDSEALLGSIRLLKTQPSWPVLFVVDGRLYVAIREQTWPKQISLFLRLTKLFDVFSKGSARKGRATPAERGSRTKGVAEETQGELRGLCLVQTAPATALWAGPQQPCLDHKAVRCRRITAASASSFT